MNETQPLHDNMTAEQQASDHDLAGEHQPPPWVDFMEIATRTAGPTFTPHPEMV